MEIESSFVNTKSSVEHEFTSSPVIVGRATTAVLIEISSIFSEFFLRVNILKSTGRVPPLRASLYHNVIRLQFLDELLSALSKHS